MFDTLFLDRDGVINEKLENRYVTCIKEFVFVDGVLESFTNINKYFKRVIIITNQQGIGKKIMTVKQLDDVHNYMISEIENSGGKINKIYFCSDLASKENNCRKPGTKMFEKALEDFPKIDLKKSFMFGDSDSDIVAGEKMGIKSVKIDHKFNLKSALKKIINIH
ncbi:MAG: phosphatase [Flavobacteriales bacterium]|nr:phosphatase [Flavobacteriales bacterium]